MAEKANGIESNGKAALYELLDYDLPTVRITGITIDNFKSVHHGTIEFNCGKQFIPYGTKSDILGIYGQNGSGKTAVIEALSILKRAMSGSTIPSTYADCVAVGSDFSRLQFSFQLQYPCGETREIEYSFCIEKVAMTKDEIESMYKSVLTDMVSDGFTIPNEEFKIRVFNERIRMNRQDENHNSIMIKQDIIDTSSTNRPFAPESKLLELVGNNPKSDIELEVAKRTTYEQSRSFVFNRQTLTIFKDSGLFSIYYQTLLELSYFASYYFYVIDTKSSGMIRLNFALPLYTRKGVMHIDVRRPEDYPDPVFESIQEDVSKVSAVLSQLVPGLTINFKKLSDTITKDNEHASSVMLMANRNGVELPLRDESDGVRKIISVLSLLIATYNEQSFTLAIDEFDAGVFEYLLGEILQIMEESGKGQFIFTSHNLRPLEVIDKKHLVFTTTNPDNRYFRLKNIGQSNNLRDIYFREILLGEQDEEVYSKTKKFKIEAALKKAGMEI